MGLVQGGGEELVQGGTALFAPVTIRVKEASCAEDTASAGKRV